MTKPILSTLLFCAVLLQSALFAQTEKIFYKNEIGTDITVLIEQLVKFNQSEFSIPYSSTYYVTYKRHLPNYSLRFGIGANASNRDDQDRSSPQRIIRNSTLINYRFGMEKQVEIGKNWRCYYGIDFRHSIFQERNDLWYDNGGWRRGFKQNSFTIGLAPVFGFECKLSKKVALQTETSCLAYISREIYQPFITQSAPAPTAPMPSDERRRNVSRGLLFRIPNFLTLSFRL